MGLNVENQLRGKVNGVNGANGNGIASIVKTGTSGLVDTYTINFTDGNTETFTVTNGAKGDTGDTGNGISSVQLNNDYTLTINFTNGESYTTTSIRGQQGEKGDKPTKGVDYFTNEEVEEFKDDIVNGANSDFNANVTEKMTAFNSNATSKTNTFNNNATAKTNAFNTNAADKTDTFDSNASTKTSAFNSNATSKTSDFDTNATNKTTTYNQNATTKTSEYNTNAQTKLEAYNTNATAKMTAYNENAEEKIEEYNDNASELMESVEALETKHDTEVAELQEQLDMTADLIPTGDASGSDITVNDSARYWFKKIVLGGKSEQATTTGANLMKFTERTSSASGIAYSCDNEGQAILIGTSTANMGYAYNQVANTIILNAGTYKFKVIGKYDTLKFSRTDINSFISLDANGEGTVIVENDNTDFRILIYTATNDTYNCNFYLTLTAENTATTERYTGGQPAPNPSYECPIQNVTGDVDVKVESKNKFDKNTITERHYLSNYGNIIEHSDFGYSDYIQVNENYCYISGCKNDAGYNASYCFYDANKNFVIGYRNSNFTEKLISIPENVEYIRFSFKLVDIDTIQLEQGSTATDYEPHEEQTAIFPLEEGQILHASDTIKDKIGQKRKTIDLSSLTWNKATTTDSQGNTFGFYATLTERPKQDTTGVNFALCNILKQQKRSEVSIFDTEGFYLGSGATLYIKIKQSLIPNGTVAELNTLLTNTNATLEYELETPIEIPFTEAQRTAKAQIDKLYSYKGTTYITSNANLDVTYRKDPNIRDTRLDALEARVALLEG